VMDTKAKLQRVLDVIDGRTHPSSLIEILPAPDVVEENVLRLAVDFLFAREREKMGGPASSYFRLTVTKTKEIREGEDVSYENEILHVTEWMPERSQISAPSAQGQLRQVYPNAEIVVERKYEH
jgi:hypothetical protein